MTYFPIMKYIKCDSWMTSHPHDHLKEQKRKLNKSLFLALLFCFNLTKVISDIIQVGLKPYLTKLGFDSNPAWLDIWYAQLETQSINSNCALNFIMYKEDIFSFWSLKKSLTSSAHIDSQLQHITELCSILFSSFPRKNAPKNDSMMVQFFWSVLVVWSGLCC